MLIKTLATLLATCTVIFGSLSLCFGDATVYVSFSDFGDGNAITNVDNSTTPLTVGETGSAYIWIFTDNDNIDTLVTGAVSLSNASTVALTGASVTNSLINPSGLNRWSTTNDGTVSVTGDAISNLIGFNNMGGGATGILLNQGFIPGTELDAGYDSSVGTTSYLFAQIDFEATAAGSVVVNPAGFLLDSAGGSIDFTTNTATIVVVAVPEPGCGIVLAGSLIMLFRRRR